MGIMIESIMENCEYNGYKLADDGETVIGNLSDGEIFKFDLCDLEKVICHKWYPSGENPSTKAIMNNKRDYLHRHIMDAPKGCEVDHIDHDRMNNCRNNLRICTHQQNQCNQPLQANNTSGVTGVRFYKARNKYVARIKYFGKDIHLGYYESFLEAIQARDFGAEMLFGKFAVLNDVPQAPHHIKKFVYEKCRKHIQSA